LFNPSAVQKFPQFDQQVGQRNGPATAVIIVVAAKVLAGFYENLLSETPQAAELKSAIDWMRFSVAAISGF